MTPAERAMLLAMAKDMVRGHPPYTRRAEDLNIAIAAVEADDKSCETCRHDVDGIIFNDHCRNTKCDIAGAYNPGWQPRAAVEADDKSCETCNGDGVPPHEPGTHPCPNCDGTGKKDMR